MIEKLTAERDHWLRRYERLMALNQADPMRRDDWGDIEYADGVRYGLDLALLALKGDEESREFMPTDDLKDAWARYQRGDEVTAWELRLLDEQRMDHAMDS